MLKLARLTALAGALALSAPARAQQPPSHPTAEQDTARARQLYERGMGHFQLEEYDQAIDKWEQGFRIKPVPEFLYNIAQAYRLSRRPEQALSFYKKYLRVAPQAANRAEVERHIDTLRATIAAQQQAATQPPDHALDATAAANGSQPTAAAATSPAPAAPPGDALVARAPARTPISKRKWFWPVVGAGAAVVVGAVIVGIVIGTRGDGYRALPDVRFQ